MYSLNWLHILIYTELTLVHTNMYHVKTQYKTIHMDTDEPMRGLRGALARPLTGGESFF